MTVKRLKRTQPKTPEQFMAYFRGIAGPRLCKAFNEITPGVIWNGCPKSHLADAWAYPRHGHTRIHEMTLAEIDATMAKIEAEK